MRKLEFNFIVQESRERVWHTLVSEKGIQKYFSKNSRLVLEPGGLFEILFDMQAPKGQQGAENMIVLSIVPYEMFSFTWNNPPILSEIRNQRTVVYILLEERQDHTLIRFQHIGFADTPIWTESMAYFKRAWGDIVLPRLKYVCENPQAPLPSEFPNINYI